jgi:uncharacterized phage infection (PIP) family protein YhgE
MSVDHDNCEKVIRLEAMVEEMKEKVSHFDKVPETLAELSTTLKYQAESNERRDALVQEQTRTLNDISTNMRLQTQTIEKLNEKIDETNTSLNEKIDSTNEKVCDLAKQVNSAKDEEHGQVEPGQPGPEFILRHVSPVRAASSPFRRALSPLQYVAHGRKTMGGSS